MVPVTVDAATAMPGQPNTVTSPAASHNLFPVKRMLISLVIMGRLYNGLSASVQPLHAGHDFDAPVSAQLSPASKAVAPQMFSKASDSASLGSRSGTSACRRISQLAVATKDPPTAMSAATSSSDGLNPSGWSVGMTCQ